MSVTLDWTNERFVRWEQLKLSSDGGDSGIKCMNEAMVAPVMEIGGTYDWLESGVSRSVLCWLVLQESDISVRENIFTLNLLCNTFYKFCIFNSICRVNAAINCIII
jgi:hypothetical protein